MPMRNMHPTRRSTIALIVAAVVLTATSGIGQDGGYWTSAPSWIGDVSWLGSMLCVLLLIVSGVYAIVSRIRHHHRALPH